VQDTFGQERQLVERRRQAEKVSSSHQKREKGRENGGTQTLCFKNYALWGRRGARRAGKDARKGARVSVKGVIRSMKSGSRGNGLSSERKRTNKIRTAR